MFIVYACKSVKAYGSVKLNYLARQSASIFTICSLPSFTLQAKAGSPYPALAIVQVLRENASKRLKSLYRSVSAEQSYTNLQ
jgi:hypothetical protein